MSIKRVYKPFFQYERLLQLQLWVLPAPFLSASVLLSLHRSLTTDNGYEPIIDTNLIVFPILTRLRRAVRRVISRLAGWLFGRCPRYTRPVPAWSARQPRPPDQHHRQRRCHRLSQQMPGETRTVRHGLHGQRNGERSVSHVGDRLVENAERQK